MLKFSILGSGSSGNAILVKSEKTNLLFDVGLSNKRIGELLRNFNIQPEEIDAVFISHEHIDHVKGLNVLGKKYNTPIFTNEKTWEVLVKETKDLTKEQRKVMPTGSILTIGDIEIESFPISHDAIEPVGYVIRHANLQIGIATDLGYVNKKIKQKLRDSHALIFESNHDVEMLRMGSYPWSLKQRILSDVGHLSNEDAAYALSEIITAETKAVFLAHLSQENNLPEIAYLTVKNILQLEGFKVGEDFSIYNTYPNKPTILYEVEQKTLQEIRK